jgi:ketosteroid isomerase-like protein
MSTSVQKNRTESRTSTAAGVPVVAAVAAANGAQIREVVEEWAEAHRVKDARRVVSQLAPGEVQFTLAPPLQHTGPNARDEKAVATWFSGFEGPMGYEVRDLAITAGEDTAFCHFLNRLSATTNHQQTFALWNRVTFGFRKLEGRWLITHVHASVPFYMDGSFRAAVDLQP